MRIFEINYCLKVLNPTELPKILGSKNPKSEIKNPKSKCI
jgi:hypothetical protein